jgi:hypothetical protein
MKVAAKLSGLLAIGLLFGCESQSHPLGPATEPVLAATRSMERVVLVEEHVFLENPCTEGTPELIDLNLTTEFVFFSLEDAEGGVRYWIRGRVLEGTGVGESSGVTYRLRWTTHEQAHLRAGPDGDSQERVLLHANLLLIAPRQPPIAVHLLYLLTTDARGEIRAERERIDIRCPA